MQPRNRRYPLPERPSIERGSSIDAVIGYPAKTLFEYLYIFGSNLTYNWEKEEDSLLISRQRKALILETMTDQDLKDLIYYKRKA